MKDSDYILERTDDLDRPWQIVSAADDAVTPTFTFEEQDEAFAREILENLNAGRTWEPVAATELENAVSSQSLEDTDSLASSA